jgi:Tol biopolymer transport system component
VRKLLYILLLLSTSVHASPTTLGITQTVNGTNYLTQMSADGQLITRLPAIPCGSVSTSCWPSWSPDGLRMLFQANLHGSALYIIKADGTNPTRLSVAMNAADTVPNFSPDGTKIVYNQVISTSGGIPETNIVTANADGTNITQILAPVALVYNLEPRWSVNNQITFFSNAGGGQDIYVICSDGSNLTRLTTTGLNGDPSWSPDGNTIVFGRAPTGPGSNLNVYTMSSVGSNVIQITNFIEPMEAGDAGFNFNGKQIAFQYDNGGNFESNTSVPAFVGIINSDGTGLNLTNVPCAQIGCHPTWSWR